MRPLRDDGSAPSAHRGLDLAARVGAGLLGGYAFVWGFVALGIALAVAAGMPYAEAQTLLYLLAFPVLLGCFFWAFVAPGCGRVWGVFSGGCALMTGAAWLVSRALL